MELAKLVEDALHKEYERRRKEVPLLKRLLGQGVHLYLFTSCTTKERWGKTVFEGRSNGKQIFWMDVTNVEQIVLLVTDYGKEHEPRLIEGIDRRLREMVPAGDYISSLDKNSAPASV